MRSRTWILLMASSLCSAEHALAQPADIHTQADESFRLGREALNRGDHALALKLFQTSHGLEPGRGTLLNMAICEEKLGLLATAMQHFQEVLQHLAADDERAPMVKQRLAGLGPRVPYLRLSLAAGAAPGSVVAHDGTALAPAKLGTEVPVDPGKHVITVSAPGRVERRYDVVVQEGEHKALGVEPGIAIQQAEPPAAARSLSHRGQFGALLRADINGQGPGILAAPGLAYGIGDHVEIATCALLGRQKGVEPAVTVLILRGAWKPRLSAAVPIFFVDGPRPGARVSAGIQWDPIRHLGVFIDAGAAVFPNAPDGYQKVVFVPSLGVEPRL